MARLLITVDGTELEDILTRVPQVRQWAVKAVAAVATHSAAHSSRIPADAADGVIDLSDMLSLGDATARQTGERIRGDEVLGTDVAARPVPCEKKSKSGGTAAGSLLEGGGGDVRSTDAARGRSTGLAPAVGADRGGEVKYEGASGGGIVSVAIVASRKMEKVKKKRKQQALGRTTVTDGSPAIVTNTGESVWPFEREFGEDSAAVTVATVTQRYSETGERYIDRHFAPQAISLAPSFVGVSDADLWESVRWIRSTDVWPGTKTVMFRGSISPRQLVTRGLQDESFISCLRVLALDETRVRRLISPLTHREAGCIVVRMYPNGKVCDVVLDDFLPCDASGTIAFSFCKDKRCVSRKGRACLSGSVSMRLVWFGCV